MKNNLPWFRHYAEAPDHPKFEALRAAYGWAGEGRFWALNCFISRAEGCRLDLGVNFLRAQIGNKLGMNVDEFNQFLSFLSDRQLCGLLRREEEVYWTDIVEDDFKRTAERRFLQSERYKSGIGKGLSALKRSEEKRREEQQQSPQDSDVRNGVSAASAAAAACSPFSPAQIQDRLAFAPLDVTLDDAAAGQVAQALQAAGCEDLAYLDWALERISARANGKPINNPAGYLLSVVGLPDWISAWRQEAAMRAAVRRPAAVPAPQTGPPEPDNPAEVAQLLGELPWKPGGRRKHAPGPDPPERNVTPEAPELPAPTDSGGAS